MKFGFRTPSLKKSIKARTTGRLKRSLKRALNPFYAKTGMGLINNSKKAIYNKVYNRVTFGLGDILKFKTKLKEIQNDYYISKKEKEKISLELNEECKKFREIICSTTNPEEFFEVYNLLVETLMVMQKYEDVVNWESANPSMMLGETIAIKGKCLKLLIDNIYEEENKNGKKTYNKLENFLESMDTESRKYLFKIKRK